MTCTLVKEMYRKLSSRKTHFHMKGYAPGLVLKQRQLGNGLLIAIVPLVTVANMRAIRYWTKIFPVEERQIYRRLFCMAVWKAGTAKNLGCYNVLGRISTEDSRVPLRTLATACQMWRAASLSRHFPAILPAREIVIQRPKRFQSACASSQYRSSSVVSSVARQNPITAGGAFFFS